MPLCSSSASTDLLPALTGCPALPCTKPLLPPSPLKLPPHWQPALPHSRPTPPRPAGLLLERACKLQSDRQQGGDALVLGGVYLYIKCLGDCCAGRPLELHSSGGSVFSGNAFEAHAGRSARCSPS